MAIKNHISKNVENREEQLYREERNFRADKLVEKWSRVPEIGKGIKEMNANTARNLAILLENQTRQMSRMNEAQLSGSFFNFTPENMLRLVRLSYPNSIRGDLFTEFAMETSHDSIKYIEPIYTNAMRDAFEIEPFGPGYKDDNHFGWEMKNRFDKEYKERNWETNFPAMYETTESRYVTELVNVKYDKLVGTNRLDIAVYFKGENTPFGANGQNYIDGSSILYVELADRKYAIAMQAKPNTQLEGVAKWFFSAPTNIDADNALKTIEVKEAHFDNVGKVCSFVVECKNCEPADLEALKFSAIGRYNSETDLTGKYLGEVELQMRDYHFRPRPITLGVTWTELTELVLDTSFGISAEEMLMDSAAQEIKKSLDFQAVKYASDVQKTFASDNFVVFEADYNANSGAIAKDSYWHQAQLIGQAIGRVEDNMLNAFNRGGVTAIVGGPKACRYLELNEGWSNKGAQPKIGGHKVGELNGIPVFKVPASIVPDNQLITTWKNDQAEGDVAIAIGTLMPFYSTGALQRKNLYKEAAVARFEDTQALQPKYLGRIQIDGIQVK